VLSCYHVIGTDALGCQDADTACVNPVMFDVDISGDAGVCLGDPATITVTDHNGQSLTYIWSPTGSTDPSIVVQPEETTTYSVTVTNPNLGCDTTLSFTVVVFMFNPIDISITAVPDSVILTQPTQLFVNQVNPEDYTYSWSSTSGPVPDPVYNPIVIPTGSTTYCVTVTDTHGCTGTACVSVGVAELFCDERDIFFPNAFSPNNDGVNDELLVRSNFVTTINLHIFNRWGEEVFVSKDINIGWDGTYKGKLLSSDIYGFFLTARCPDGKTYFKKGNVALLN
jgi:gliding motility-associated-like protein